MSVIGGEAAAWEGGIGAAALSALLPAALQVEAVRIDVVPCAFQIIHLR